MFFAQEEPKAERAATLWTLSIDYCDTEAGLQVVSTGSRIRERVPHYMRSVTLSGKPQRGTLGKW